MIEEALQDLNLIRSSILSRQFKWNENLFHCLSCGSIFISFLSYRGVCGKENVKMKSFAAYFDVSLLK